MRARPVYADRRLVVEEVLPLHRLRFTGEIDGGNATAVTRSLVAALRGGADVHVDLSAAEFHDSSGLDALLAAADSAGTGRLVLHGLPPLLETALCAVARGRRDKVAISIG